MTSRPRLSAPGREVPADEADDDEGRGPGDNGEGRREHDEPIRRALGLRGVLVLDGWSGRHRTTIARMRLKHQQIVLRPTVKRY